MLCIVLRRRSRGGSRRRLPAKLIRWLWHLLLLVKASLGTVTLSSLTSPTVPHVNRLLINSNLNPTSWFKIHIFRLKPTLDYMHGDTFYLITSRLDIFLIWILNMSFDSGWLFIGAWSYLTSFSLFCTDPFNKMFETTSSRTLVYYFSFSSNSHILFMSCELLVNSIGNTEINFSAL